MILVQTDEQLVRHIEGLLALAQDMAGVAKTQRGKATAEAWAYGLEEALDVVKTHARQAKLPLVSLEAAEPAFVAQVKRGGEVTQRHLGDEAPSEDAEDRYNQQ